MSTSPSSFGDIKCSGKGCRGTAILTPELRDLITGPNPNIVKAASEIVPCPKCKGILSSLKERIVTVLGLYGIHSLPEKGIDAITYDESKNVRFQLDAQKEDRNYGWQFRCGNDNFDWYPECPFMRCMGIGKIDLTSMYQQLYAAVRAPEKSVEANLAPIFDLCIHCGHGHAAACGEAQFVVLRKEFIRAKMGKCKFQNCKDAGTTCPMFHDVAERKRVHARLDAHVEAVLGAIPKASVWGSKETPLNLKSPPALKSSTTPSLPAVKVVSSGPWNGTREIMGNESMPSVETHALFSNKKNATSGQWKGNSEVMRNESMPSAEINSIFSNGKKIGKTLPSGIAASSELPLSAVKTGVADNRWTTPMIVKAPSEVRNLVMPPSLTPVVINKSYFEDDSLSIADAHKKNIADLRARVARDKANKSKHEEEIRRLNREIESHRASIERIDKDSATADEFISFYSRSLSPDAKTSFKSDSRTENKPEPSVSFAKHNGSFSSKPSIPALSLKPKGKKGVFSVNAPQSMPVLTDSTVFEELDPVVDTSLTNDDSLDAQMVILPAVNVSS